MPLTLEPTRPSVLIRKQAFERSALSRPEIDAKFNLTDQEFRVEGPLIVIGPLPSDDLVGPMVEYFESKGLVYFDDFFEMSGNWPKWMRIFVS